MISRALWHPLSVIVTDIDPSLPACHRYWLASRLRATPRKGGITLNEGTSTSPVIESWSRCVEVIQRRVDMALERACGIEDVATGRYWLDHVERWRLLYGLLERHRRALWPAECDCD